jgi:pyruvate/2-oxoglutarate/acetoin dehydrogenase E1 component
MYKDELTSAMTWLGKQPDTIFIGQAVRYPGNALFDTLQGVPMDKRVEVGVMEDTQLGMAIGLARTGKLPICIFPRMDFLMCAMNQLINHLDKYPVRVIIRTCIGSKTPLDPGSQHSGDYVKGLRELVNHNESHIRVVDLTEVKDIQKLYIYAAGNKQDRLSESYGVHWTASIMVERAELYGVE